MHRRRAGDADLAVGDADLAVGDADLAGGGRQRRPRARESGVGRWWRIESRHAYSNAPKLAGTPSGHTKVTKKK